jgi:hypothetical protein
MNRSASGYTTTVVTLVPKNLNVKPSEAVSGSAEVPVSPKVDAPKPA